MMELKITVDCPSLAQLATAILRTPTAPAPMAPVPTMPAPTPTVAPPAPVTGAPVSPAAPAAAPAPNFSPAPSFAPPPTAPVTAAPTYTYDQITKAGADLAAAGKMAEVTALLPRFGVQAVSQVPPERLGELAMALRGLGAQI